ncbi:hypothetical protein EDD21DRAFT_281694, partial [Dissophora ornata]
GKTVGIESDTSFCMFLPPRYGEQFALTLDSATAYCTNPSPLGVTIAQDFPPNFMLSHTFTSNATAGYVQVTGTMDPFSGFRDPTFLDHGGVVDMKVNLGSSCFGYNSFVQMANPHFEYFCIRCCTNASDCPSDLWDSGC